MLVSAPATLANASRAAGSRVCCWGCRSNACTRTSTSAKITASWTAGCLASFTALSASTISALASSIFCCIVTSCTSTRARFFFALACRAKAESSVAPTGFGGLAFGATIYVLDFGRSRDPRRNSSLSSRFEALRVPDPSTRRALAILPVSVATGWALPRHLSPSPRLGSFVRVPLPSLLLPSF